MKNQCKLSNVAKNYLSEFYSILDEMIEKMTCAELDNSISHNFIVQMIPHHRAAIEMSRNILKYTTCVPLQNIALNIISEQTKSIEDMKNAECRCGDYKNCERDLLLYQRRFDEITRKMFNHMGSACSNNNVTADFMRQMIPHHRGAVEMSENALRFELCPQLLPILDSIITSQLKGIEEMTQLLACL